jgi:hypothetical protein
MDIFVSLHAKANPPPSVLKPIPDHPLPLSRKCICAINRLEQSGRFCEQNAITLQSSLNGFMVLYMQTVFVAWLIEVHGCCT